MKRPVLLVVVSGLLTAAALAGLILRRHEEMERRQEKRHRAFAVDVDLPGEAAKERFEAPAPERKSVAPSLGANSDFIVPPDVDVGKVARPELPLFPTPTIARPGGSASGYAAIVSKSAASARYLIRFGYLDADAREEDLQVLMPSAIAAFQRHVGLKVTGQLDADSQNVMSLSRCAFPDIDPLGVTKVGPWRKMSLGYGFGHILGSWPDKEIRAALHSAFSTWEATGIGIAFREAPEPSDIKVEWRPGSDPDYNMKSKGLVAHSDFPPGFSLIPQSDPPPLPLHFNENEMWSTGPVQGHYDIETVALHEIGHCLGLQHSASASSIMYPLMQTNSVSRQLSAEDVASLKSLYRESH